MIYICLKEERIVFPRYHQFTAVRQLEQKTIERLNKSPELFTKILTDDKYADELFAYLVKLVYQQIVGAFRDQI